MAWVVTAVAAAFEVGATAAVIMTAVSEVGMAMTVVGGLTGNKDLMKVGGVLGIAGGIGGAAAGGLFGDTVAGAVNGSIGSGATNLAGDTLKAALDGTTDFGANSASGALDLSSLGSGESGTLDAALNSGGNLSSPTLAAATDATGASSPSGFLDGAGGTNQIADPSQALGTTPTPGAAVAPTTGAPPPATVSTGAPASVSDGSLTSSASYDPSTATRLSDFQPGGKNYVQNGLFDSAKQWMSGLPPQAQAEILKAAMAVPGGIQAQTNKAQELAIQQQRVNQTGFGSSVTNYYGPGIIANAQKKV